jgi:hypothetical protein
MQSIESRPNDALKLIFMWIKQGKVDYKEFENLVKNVSKSYPGMDRPAPKLP